MSNIFYVIIEYASQCTYHQYSIGHFDFEVVCYKAFETEKILELHHFVQKPCELCHRIELTTGKNVLLIFR